MPAWDTAIDYTPASDAACFVTTATGLHITRTNTGPTYGNSTDPDASGQTLWQIVLIWLAKVPIPAALAIAGIAFVVIPTLVKRIAVFATVASIQYASFDPKKDLTRFVPAANYVFATYSYMGEPSKRICTKCGYPEPTPFDVAAMNGV